MNPNNSTMPKRPTRLIAVAIAAAVVLAVVAIGFAVNRSSGDPSAAPTDGSAAEGSADTTPSSSTPDPEATTPSTDPTATTVAPEPRPTPTTPPIPLDVTVSSTDDLRDGSEVAVHVTPQSGSQVFGLEAFICAPDVSFRLDADIRPTQTGKCITKPLSDASDDYEQVAAAPPYSSVDLRLKVGVGTDTYTTNLDRPVTITCGPAHPCQLVLKLQYPDGFGFQAYPLTFA